MHLEGTVSPSAVKERDMGMDAWSRVCYGSIKLSDFNLLPDKIRQELDDDGGGTFEFIFNNPSWKNLYIERYTDSAGEFIGFGVEVSQCHFEDEFPAKALDPFPDVASSEACLKVFEMFKELKIKPTLFHFLDFSY